MADLFTRLAKRTLGLMPVVEPRIVSRFAQEEAMASENANIEIPSLFSGDRGSSLSPVQPVAGQLWPRERDAAVKDRAVGDADIPEERGYPEREEESITRTILVEMEQEYPEKQEVIPEGLSISEGRREVREAERGKSEKKPFGLEEGPKKREVQGERRAVQREYEGREKIGSVGVEKGSEMIGWQREEARGIEESSGSRGAIAGQKGESVEKVKKVTEAEKEGRESPGEISEGGEERTSLQVEIESRRSEVLRSPGEERAIGEKVEVEWDRERRAIGEKVEVEWEGEKGEREKKAVGVEWERRERDPRDKIGPSREEKKIASVRESSTQRSRSNSGEERAIGRIRESGESESPEKTRVARTVTAAIFSRNPEKSRESVGEMTGDDRVTEGKTDSGKVKSPGVERVFSSESPGIREVPSSGRMEETWSRREERLFPEEEKSAIGPQSGKFSSVERESPRVQMPSRGPQVLDSQSASEFSTEKYPLGESRRAIASGSRGEYENRVTQAKVSEGKTDFPLVKSPGVENLRSSESPGIREVPSSGRMEETWSPREERFFTQEEKSAIGPQSVKLSSVERESPLPSVQMNSRGSQVLDSKRNEEFSTENFPLGESRRAIASGPRVEYENRVTPADEPKRESLSSIPLVKGEKQVSSQSRARSASSISGEESGTVGRVAERSHNVDESPEITLEVPIAEGKRDWEENNQVGREQIISQREERGREIEIAEKGELQLLDSRRSPPEKASVESTIEVTIGKIEVRGTKPAVKPVQQSRRMQSTGSSPRLSLDEYLKQRNGGKR
ncbi:MAG: hypothetical protein AB4352_11925 [Hormoscilla sp.]